MMLKRLALMMGVLGLWACGSDSGNPMMPDGGDPYQPAPLPPLGEAITATPGTWTWVDFPDSRCDDGTPTGIAINPAATGKDLVVFFNGGGACWDRTTCLILNTSSHGPFNRTNFEQMKGQVAGSVLDRTLAGSPFATYSMVFVPYCTGDVHAGDKQADYGNGKPFYHSGYKNTEAFLKRLRPTFPSVDHLVVTGSSGGGFGSAFNYDQFRRFFPDAKRAYLLDDSGPPFIGDAVDANLRTSWYDAWGLSTTVGARCPGCRDDFSGMLTALSRRCPSASRRTVAPSSEKHTRRGVGLPSRGQRRAPVQAIASMGRACHASRSIHSNRGPWRGPPVTTARVPSGESVSARAATKESSLGVRSLPSVRLHARRRVCASSPRSSA